MIKSKEKEVIQRFKERVAETFAGRLDRVVLFGSRGRGNAEEDSDFDFLVMVKKLETEDKKRVREVAWEISLEHDTVITALVTSTADFREERYFYLYENIQNEGKVI